MNDDNPTRTEIDEQLEEAVTDSWMLADYEYTEGQYETARLTIELEYTPPTELESLLGLMDAPRAARTVKNVIRKHQQEHEPGAPIADVVDELKTEHEFDADEVDTAIQELKNKGDIYEPQTDHLRVV